MSSNASLKDMLGDFSAVSGKAAGPRQCVTIWLSPEDKARYDRLQEMSGRNFSKKLREIIQAAIELAAAQPPASAP